MQAKQFYKNCVHIKLNPGNSTPIDKRALQKGIFGFPNGLIKCTEILSEVNLFKLDLVRNTFRTDYNI